MGFSRLYARKLAILVAAIGITVLPSFVYGLGLGAIKLNSSLSEILDAEIDLIAATENDVSDLKVKLASSEAFLRAGIEKTTLLSTLRFAVKRTNSGQYIIKVTSRKPIREPFLNFLLEVNWKNGRMLREYTMLIDPPGRRIEQTQQSTIQSAQISEPEAAQSAVEPTPFKAGSVDVVDDNVNNAELFPRRSIDEVAAPEEKQVAVEKVVEPEAMAAEPILPETIPEPEVISPEPEPFIPEATPEPERIDNIVVDDSKGVSGEVRAEHMQSGQVIGEQEMAQNEMMANETETFGEGELFPTIPLTEYDESKSIKYDEEPIVPVDDNAISELADEHQAPSDSVSNEMESGSLDYGITKKSDNLWSIANRMKGDDASVYQVMMALLKSNPNAFTEGNVHRLKVGQVLRIEDPSLITAISKTQAAQDYTAQTEAWESYRQQVAAAAGDQPLSTGQVDLEPADNIAEAPSGELTLSAPEGDDLAASTAPTQDGSSDEVARLRSELDSITQQADAERGKNSALNERLRKLESELEAMQRSLSVRNDEFAALQQQVNKEPDTAEVQAEIAPVPEQMPAEIAQQETPPTPQLEDEPVAVAEVVEPETAPEEAPLAVEQPAEPVVDAPVAELPMENTAIEDTPIEEPTAQVSTSLVDTIVSTILGIIKPILGSSLLIFIGIPVLIIVIILIVIMMLRKRSTAKDNFQESILSGAAPIDDEPSVSVSSQNSSETSSFLSDFAISGVGAIQTEDSEVDPLTEADVFMAYGRYEAAEERLQEAIAADPERSELKVKLLEVYNTNKNQSAFESTAEDLYASLGDDAAEDSNWQKVVVMGKQIAPNNPIFSHSPTITSETTESVLGAMEENLSNVSMTDSQVMDIGLETGVFSAEELNPDAGSSDTDADMGSLDFNLGDDAPVTNQQETQDNISQPDTLDFNLDESDDAEPATQTASLDFNLDEAEDEDESTKSMAIDLNALSDADNSDDEPTASMVIDSDALDLDSTSAQLDTGSLDFSLDSVDESDGSLDLNLDAGDAMDMSLTSNADEVGTKLDLAKAYIDMGDSAGAKSILDEVLAEGNDDQKQEAEQLVSQLS